VKAKGGLIIAGRALGTGDRECRVGDRAPPGWCIFFGLLAGLAAEAIRVYFRRTVCLTGEVGEREKQVKISARNVIKGKVVDIKEGPVNSQIRVDIGGNVITSMITTDATKELDISVGSEVQVVIKASEVMLAID
jgi:molybdopterin-binding protein